MTAIAETAGHALSIADAARVQEALDNSISEATKIAYASDWHAFTGWFSTSGFQIQTSAGPPRRRHD